MICEEKNNSIRITYKGYFLTENVSKLTIHDLTVNRLNWFEVTVNWPPLLKTFICDEFQHDGLLKKLPTDVKLCTDKVRTFSNICWIY